MESRSDWYEAAQAATEDRTYWDDKYAEPLDEDGEEWEDEEALITMMEIIDG